MRRMKLGLGVLSLRRSTGSGSKDRSVTPKRSRCISVGGASGRAQKGRKDEPVNEMHPQLGRRFCGVVGFRGRALIGMLKQGTRRITIAFQAGIFVCHLMERPLPLFLVILSIFCSSLFAQQYRDGAVIQAEDHAFKLEYVIDGDAGLMQPWSITFLPVAIFGSGQNGKLWLVQDGQLAGGTLACRKFMRWAKPVYSIWSCTRSMQHGWIYISFVGASGKATPCDDKAYPHVWTNQGQL